MPILSDEGADFAAVHLLLLANTKMGKSRYVANAVKDGFSSIYLDADNGKGTLLEVLGSDKEALSRVLHIPTTRPYLFLRTLVDSKGVMRWNLTRDEPYDRGRVSPTDMIAELNHAMIPRTTILAVDSWTSVSDDALKSSALTYDVDLDTMSEQKSMSVRGQAGTRCNRILSALQKAPYHVIVQGHTAFYERQEKPTGVAKDSKMGDMIIKENVAIPYSASKPHGYSMGKYFNEIGWLTIDRTRKIVLDFQKLADRIGGGRRDSAGDPNTAFSFKNLYGDPNPEDAAVLRQLYREFPASELSNATSANPVDKPATVAKTPDVSPAPSGALPPATPKAGGLAGLMMKKT